MKRSFSLILVLVISMAFLTSCKEAGTVSGVVEFSGVPCKKEDPDYRVPPCTGAYPDYSIEVFKKGSKDKPVLTTKSDKNGKFKIELPAGEYVIYTQDGLTKENMKANAFTIEAGKDIPLNLQIRTGVQ